MERKAAPSPGLKLVATRRRSGKGYIPFHLLNLLIGAGIAAVGVFGLVTGIPPTIFFALAPVPLLGGWIYATLALRSRTYRLFNESLEVETGLLTRRIENLQLFRVRDVTLRQGVFGRLFNVGDVLVTSTDTTSPHLSLIGIDDPQGFYRQIRELVTIQGEKRTMVIEKQT